MSANEALAIRGEEEALAVLDAPMLRARVRVIQQVMRDVMQEGVHYKTLPGTKDPFLEQPGAEILCLTFGISIKCEPIEERITDEEVFYRVRATAYSNSGREIGSREAACSTQEKKYKWRAPVHIKEWEATPEHLRRITWEKDGTERPQVRQEPGELVETILGMANKRAHSALTRQVTGCSGIFKEKPLAEPEPEQPPIDQPAPASEGPQPTETQENGGPPPVKIASCKKLKAGTSDRGDWVLFGVTTSDGAEYTTFDQKVFAACMKAQAEKVAVRISSEPVEGKSPRIVEVVRVQ